MKWTSTKTFDKLPAPTLVLQVVPKTKNVSFPDHSRPKTIKVLLHYIQQTERA